MLIQSFTPSFTNVIPFIFNSIVTYENSDLSVVLCNISVLSGKVLLSYLFYLLPLLCVFYFYFLESLSPVTTLVSLFNVFYIFPHGPYHYIFALFLMCFLKSIFQVINLSLNSNNPLIM